MTTSTSAPFGHIIDSRTGDQIRPATSQEWSNNAHGRFDPGHFFITTNGKQRLVFCDGPSIRTSAVTDALAAELSEDEREIFDRVFAAAGRVDGVTPEQARELAIFEVMTNRERR